MVSDFCMAASRAGGTQPLTGTFLIVSRKYVFSSSDGLRARKEWGSRALSSFLVSSDIVESTE